MRSSELAPRRPGLRRWRASRDSWPLHVRESRAMTPAPFIHPLRVRYAECDPQEIVFNANYFAYFDVAMTELWRAAIGRYGAMLERGVDMVVAEASARFLGAARFDDELALEVSIARLGRTACTTRHRVLRDGETLVEGT